MARRRPGRDDGSVAAMRDVRVTPATARPDPGPATIAAGTVMPSGHEVGIGHIGELDVHGRRLVEVIVDGWRFEYLVEDEARAALRDRASRDRGDHLGAGEPLEIRAIIPGRVASVSVTPGDRVEVGQTLLAVEAMKMQNELRAPRAGTVTRVAAAAGAAVELGDLLVVIE